MNYNQNLFGDQHLPGGFNIFDYNGRLIRMLYIQNELWFVHRDVCAVIGLSNPSKAAERLDDYEKMTLTLGESHFQQRGGAQKVILINESGFYHLMLSSHKSEAKEFQRWVTSEVIPSIRKNGGYIMGQDAMDAGELADAALQVVQNILTTQDRRIRELQRENAEQAVSLREYIPKARYYDIVLQRPVLLTIAMIAKEYDMSAQAMNRYLSARGVQRRCGSTWVLYPHYAGKGYVHPDPLCGAAYSSQHTRWTQMGRAFIHDLFRADGILPLYERPYVYVPEDINRFTLL